MNNSRKVQPGGEKNKVIRPKTVTVKSKAPKDLERKKSKKVIKFPKEVEKNEKEQNPESSQKIQAKIIIQDEEVEIGRMGSLINSELESRTVTTQKAKGILKDFNSSRTFKDMSIRELALEFNKDIDFGKSASSNDLNQVDEIEEDNEENDLNDESRQILLRGTEKIDYFELNKLKLNTFAQLLHRKVDKEAYDENGSSKFQESSKDIFDEAYDVLTDSKGKWLIDLDSNFKKWWDIFNLILIVKKF